MATEAKMFAVRQCAFRKPESGKGIESDEKRRKDRKTNSTGGVPICSHRQLRNRRDRVSEAQEGLRKRQTRQLKRGGEEAENKGTEEG